MNIRSSSAPGFAATPWARMALSHGDFLWSYWRRRPVSCVPTNGAGMPNSVARSASSMTRRYSFCTNPMRRFFTGSGECMSARMASRMPAITGFKPERSYFDRSVLGGTLFALSSTVNPSQELINHVAHLALTQCPRLALLGFLTLAKFELGHRDRAILAITLDFLVLDEAPAENFKR